MWGVWPHIMELHILSFTQLRAFAMATGRFRNIVVRGQRSSNGEESCYSMIQCIKFYLHEKEETVVSTV